MNSLIVDLTLMVKLVMKIQKINLCSLVRPIDCKAFVRIELISLSINTYLILISIFCFITLP